MNIPFERLIYFFFDENFISVFKLYFVGNLKKGNNKWIFGYSFLNNVISVFDYEKGDVTLYSYIANIINAEASLPFNIILLNSIVNITVIVVSLINSLLQ